MLPGLDILESLKVHSGLTILGHPVIPWELVRRPCMVILLHHQ